MPALRSLRFLAVAVLLFLASPLAGELRAAYTSGENVSSVTRDTAEAKSHDGRDEHDGPGRFAGHMHDWTSASDHSHEVAGFLQLESAEQQVCAQSWQRDDAARRWPCLLIAFERPPRFVLAT